MVFVTCLYFVVPENLARKTHRINIKGEIAGAFYLWMKTTKI